MQRHEAEQLEPLLDAARAGTGSRPAYALERRLLRRLLHAAGSPPADLLLWDGTRVEAPSQPALATVHVASRATLYRILADPEVQLAEAYVAGDLRIAGDLVELLARADAVAPRRGSWRAELAHRLRRYQWAIGPRHARRNIEHHYHLGDAFYRLWLDPTMTYTCAYFPTRGTTLHEAQIAKMERICAKLALRPDETVVEAGSGWGELALFMAERHGVRVRAFNVSAEQTERAREAAARRGLAGRVEFVAEDYREIRGRYDAFVSVGMLEHVGTRHYRELGRTIARCLGGAGRGLVHSIGRHRHFPPNRWMQRTIFPEGYVPSLREMMDVFEAGDLTVEDVENLRPHYVRTLEHWLAAFESSAEEVERMFDERFVRTWRLYLATCIASFRAGWHQLYQVVFTPSTGGAEPPRRVRDG